VSPEAQAEALTQLIATTGPLASLMVMGFYWLRQQLDKITETQNAVKEVKAELTATGKRVVRTEAHVGALAAVLSVKLPEAEEG